MKFLKVSFLILIINLSSCTPQRLGEQKSLGLNVTNTLTADIETTPTPQGSEDDSADDPAIWVNPTNPEKSIIFGTDKKGGIGSYALDGKEIAYDAVGKMNNIDIRQNVMMNGEKLDVLVGSNRSTKSLILAIIQKDGSLDFKTVAGTDILQENSVYGFALGYVNNKLLAFVNNKKGDVFIFNLVTNNEEWTANLLKKIKVNSQPEGMVVDDEKEVIYIGEEEKGIWRVDLNNYNFYLLPQSQEADNPYLKYDIEGLTLYAPKNEKGYLIASSQGNNSYAIYEREGDNKYITSFRIVDGVIDGVEETDGIDAIVTPLGDNFPNGILVVQDGFNYDGKKKKSQNFKIIDWRKVKNILQP